MDSSRWTELTVSLSTAFDRPRERRPLPFREMRGAGPSDWACGMDATRIADHRRLMRAAAEINRQRAAGEDVRCDTCGMFAARWELDSRNDLALGRDEDGNDAREVRHHRDGVELLRCQGCWLAQSVGLPSRLELGRAHVRWER